MNVLIVTRDLANAIVIHAKRICPVIVGCQNAQNASQNLVVVSMKSVKRDGCANAVLVQSII